MKQEASAAPWLARHLRPLILATLTLVAYAAALNRGQTMLWAIAALMSATLLVGVIFMVVNIASEVIQAALDPRSRLA